MTVLGHESSLEMTKRMKWSVCTLNIYFTGGSVSFITSTNEAGNMFITFIYRHFSSADRLFKLNQFKGKFWVKISPKTFYNNELTV